MDAKEIDKAIYDSLFKCSISREQFDREVFIERLFQKQNDGKPSHQSVEHGETFTAIYVIKFANECVQKYAKVKK